jgi:hypothetical protein
MNVNSFHRAFRSRRFGLVAASAISLCAILLLAAFISARPEEEIFSKRVNIAVRAIGHNLLLQAGDSTSVVLPVTEKSKGVFLLKFEKEFVFQPDTLVAIVQRFLAKTDLSRYTVTVYECHSPDIVYGFEVNPPASSVTPCAGRPQPKGCYNIEIAFADFPGTSLPYAPISIVISGVLSVLALVLIASTRRSHPVLEQKPIDQNKTQALPTLGRFVCDTINQTLMRGEETILLTDKEWKILTLLNRNIGQLTLREDLIQEVWSDEGVITGRSLDMFISKLRKKLSADPDLRITNVHGKGYRLEIVNGFAAD